MSVGIDGVLAIFCCGIDAYWLAKVICFLLIGVVTNFNTCCARVPNRERELHIKNLMSRHVADNKNRVVSSYIPNSMTLLISNWPILVALIYGKLPFVGKGRLPHCKSWNPAAVALWMQSTSFALLRQFPMWGSRACRGKEMEMRTWYNNATSRCWYWTSCHTVPRNLLVISINVFQMLLLMMSCHIWWDCSVNCSQKRFLRLYRIGILPERFILIT